MANEFKVKNGLIVVGDLTTSGTITINGALAATQSWVTSQAYLTSASLSGYATQSYVTSAISALVDAAPGTLDTLNELAAALGDDASFSTTVTNSIAAKQPQLNGTGFVKVSGTSVTYDNNTYLTSYTETDTLNSVTGRGASTANLITVGGATISNNLITTNGIADPAYARITNPGGGISVGNSPISAAIKIALPANGSFTNIMLSFTVHIYDYALGRTRTLKIAGYTYFNQDWYNVSVYQSGGELIENINVRFGVEGGRNCVWIGETNTYWSYPNIFVTDVQCGHSQTANLTSGWSISLATSFGTVQSTLVAYTNITTKDIGGTTNYVSKFTGAKTLGNSLIFDNGTNIGIGTASPGYKLDIQGIVSVGTTAVGGTLRLEGKAGFSYPAQISTATVSGIKFSDDSGGMNVVFLSSGNVGIGTVSPSGKLDVVPVSQNGINVARAGGYPSIYSSNDFVFETDSIFYFGVYTPRLFSVNGSFYTTAAGSVGIGTSSPGYKLDVQGSAGNITINTNGSLSAGGQFISGTGEFASSSSGTDLNFRAGATHLMVLKTSGNVGIGTVSPATSLEVQGAASTQIQAIFQSASSGNAAYNGGIQLGNAAASQKSSIVHDSSGDNTLTFTSHYSSGSANKFIFAPGGTETVRFQQNGNVGIGTTDPTSQMSGTFGIGIYNASYPAVGFKNSTTAWLWYGQNSTFKMWNVTAGDILTANTSGNIGIGTTSPSTKLDVNGVISATGGNSTNWNTAYGWGNHASADYIVRGTQIASSASWTTATRFGSVGAISQDAGNHALSVRSELGNDAFMSFHIGSDYAVHFGLDGVSNRMSVGGWSDGAVKYQLWDTRDFTSTNVSNWNTAYGWGNHASAGYLTSVTNISGYAGTLIREDNRTISPSELTAGQMKFGFTSWNNDNSSPYADFIHMRSYTDSSGGSDNLVMFLKSGIGMRIYQQTFGSGSAYSSYADVWHSGNLTNLNQLSNGPGYITASALSPYLPLAGGTMSGSLTFSSAYNAYIYTFSRVGLANQGRIIYNNGTGSNMFFGELASNIYGFTSNAYTDTPALSFNLSTNNVGIGTSTPGSKLHVISNENSDAAGAIRTTALNLSQYADYSFGGITSSYFYRIVSGTNQHISLMPGGTGNVGIGTNSPTEKLHVVGNQYITGNITVGASGNYSNVNFIRNDGSGVGGIGWRSDGIFYVGGHLDYGPNAGNAVRVYGFGANLSLGNNTAGDVLTVTNGGNVGIGTTSPSEKFHVLGRGIFDGGSGDSSTDAVLYVTKSNNNDWGLYVNAAALDYGMYARVSPSANYAIAVNNGTSWTTRITGNAVIYLGEKNAIEGNYDTWLRLNNQNHYASGVYTPGVMRADGGFNVSGSTVWHSGNDGSGSGLDADLLDGQNSTEFLRLLSGGAEASLDSYTDNGIRPVSFAGHSQHLLSWNAGGSTGTVQQLFHYGVPNNGWRIRNKTDNSSWSDWGYVVMASSNQGLISGTIATQSWVGSQSYATTSYVTTQINNLIAGAPGALDTLDELAAALGDDASFATTVTNSIAGKVSKAGDTITGKITFPPAVANRPQFPGGILGLDVGDGNFDIWGISRDYYPSHPTPSSAWGLRWNGDNNDFEFVGAGANRIVLDMDAGNLTIAGFLTESSSLKLKENVKTSEGNLEKVVNLRPVTYNKIGSQTKELGLIAEEVATVYPEFVQYDESGEPVGVNYSRLTAALIGAVKELTQRIETLENNG